MNILKAYGIVWDPEIDHPISEYGIGILCCKIVGLEAEEDRLVISVVMIAFDPVKGILRVFGLVLTGCNIARSYQIKKNNEKHTKTLKSIFLKNNSLKNFTNLSLQRQ